ncbi:hypothetical protein LY90DRAFT_709016 [Neocallimastix californiae]|uniref:Uncharacterized protein n=1 Tax=Neocallimastix californiae TaxID=1754190 RepID=A0A1Y1ZFJ6_9FUNG|nr:hypothetical protein LY90DRAFT_709016 [Neocallimastix californiae]|eukprot:ORY09042.1 hypothetical protein LY90DRAFT_709016 [Neocallimastix californiae]
MIKNSDEMLEVTLHKNVKTMCEILDKLHMEKIIIEDKLDHGNLKRVIDYSYFNARTKYDIEEESPRGHGRADIIFLPKRKNKVNGEIIIIELKVNSTAKKAINQIHQKKYYNEYSYVIEEYNNNMKLLSTSESAKRKRRNELEINSENKRLKSSSSKP